jgi:hypothetical protein
VRIPPDNRRRIIEQIKQNSGMKEKDFGEYERLVQGLLPHPFGSNQASAEASGASGGKKKGGEADLESLARERNSTIPGATSASSAIKLGADVSKKNELLQLVKESSGTQVNISDSNEDSNVLSLRTTDDGVVDCRTGGGGEVGAIIERSGVRVIIFGGANRKYWVARGWFPTQVTARSWSWRGHRCARSSRSPWSGAV